MTRTLFYEAATTLQDVPVSKSNRLEDTCPHMAQEGRNSPSGPSHQLLLLACSDLPTAQTHREGGLINSWAFPGGPVVTNLSCSPRDASSIPGPERSHMQWSNKVCVPQLLTPHLRALEPQLLKPVHPEPMCSIAREATAMRNPCTATREQPPLAASRESLCSAMKTQCRQK